MTDSPKFKPVVALIDASFLSSTVCNLKRAIEQHNGLTLQDFDLTHWICNMVKECDADYSGDIQVLLVSDKQDCMAIGCCPDNLEAIDGKATEIESGEMGFSIIQTESLVDKDELITDMLGILIDAKEVNMIVIVPNNNHTIDHIDDMTKKLIESQGNNNQRLFSKARLFCMGKTDCHHQCQKANVFISIAATWGIMPG